ncbi:MAG: ATP-binding cassette domain-containing protein [Flavobacterium sp.]|nr:ATP-binding cassette domain-containing protein [Pedobacter sp.]
MIHVHGVSKNYGSVKAVKNISFQIKKGETLVLLGTSGCGKTTTLRMLNRLIEPTEGFIEIDGRDILKEQPDLLRRRIGYVLQNNGLFPHYTVAENIAIVPKLLKWDTMRIQKRSVDILNKLHLPHEKFLHLFPSQLSGGQQQRVGLARALMSNPPILLMDEPLGSLDPVTRAGIRKEFIELDELKEKTIVMVTHDVLEAFELADRICLMDKGEIIQIGSAYDLLFKPANNFVKDFFQDQRLQLELKTLKLIDVWNLLSAHENLPAENFLNYELDIWTALNFLLSSESKAVRVKNTLTDEFKVCGYKELMNAYSLVKNGSHE